ncbi:hypothetical protein [Enterobacter phage vB_ExiM_F5M1E]|nr:hypothetical protein [Enterobacter phage vB_ExiM_F1M1E]UNA03026.1 hypothetical protein [Enterobacter phage vB_ExiM_F2M1E]UNA03347.1 hypothetical protein [Enterobacter phage vB_ExiM_F4M1E]UNA03668.1 hypothetical protein [Enterobacter phage vB_ExiM_F5M1E]UNA03988.1 hypothetical protein [Pantoea phage vB_PdiM_F5M2A]
MHKMRLVRSLRGVIMFVYAHDIKCGDTFRYACDWDILGKAIMSQPILASDDAIVIGTQVMIPFGGDEGRTFMACFGDKVEKIDGTD